MLPPISQGTAREVLRLAGMEESITFGAGIGERRLERVHSAPHSTASKESTPKGRGFGIAAPWKGAKRNPFKNGEKTINPGRASNSDHAQRTWVFRTH